MSKYYQSSSDDIEEEGKETRSEEEHTFSDKCIDHINNIHKEHIPSEKETTVEDLKKSLYSMVRSHFRFMDTLRGNLHGFGVGAVKRDDFIAGTMQSVDQMWMSLRKLLDDLK